MSKKSKSSTALGKSIINNRFGNRRAKKGGNSFLHSTELDDGYDWARLNLQSVTDQSNLDDFLATADLAGTEFTAEKLNVKIVDNQGGDELMSQEEAMLQETLQEENKQFLTIPRRPPWNKEMTVEELDSLERQEFLKWRRQLAKLEETKGIHMTPFEKQLDFWRQLWRVVERSDVVVQIVDARNPLLFYSEDLSKYVVEISKEKVNMILINKADYLTVQQRQLWCDYFTQEGIQVAFWSAALQTEKNKEASHEAEPESESKLSDESEVDDSGSEVEMCDKVEVDNVSESDESHDDYGDDDEGWETEYEEECICVNENDKSTQDHTHPSKDAMHNSPELLDGEGLVELLKNIHSGDKVKPGVTTIGLVGYPNVGKSSTINAVLESKKVPVSATPGRTKHFQTIFVDESLLLCDCPGLVMPTFVHSTAHMVLNGILPIDQLRDYVTPAALVGRLIPRDLLEATYGIMLPRPGEAEAPDRPPTAHELLGSYGSMRGFMTHKGIPDFQRSSRCILKDFVNGKLLYCNPPPDCDEDIFKPTPDLASLNRTVKFSKAKAEQMENAARMETFEEQMRLGVSMQVHSRGVHGVTGYTRKDGNTAHHSSEAAPPTEAGSSVHAGQPVKEKPWRQKNNKRGKREKLRRQYAHLDA